MQLLELSISTSYKNVWLAGSFDTYNEFLRPLAGSLKVQDLRSLYSMLMVTHSPLDRGRSNSGNVHVPAID